MYKNLFRRVWEILTSPSRTWDKIAQEPEDDKKYLYHFFYPLIGLAAFTALINPFLSGYEDLETKAVFLVGIQYFIVSFVSGLSGFYVTSRILDSSFVRWFGMRPDRQKAERLTAYSSTPVLVVSIFTRLLSDFFFMKILFVYVVVLVWEATAHFYALEESKRGRFTTLASICILVVPVLIEKILLVILPGLR